MHQFLIFILGMKLYMFRTVPLSIVRSFSLYTQQWFMSYRYTCPKHVEFHSKNKIEKLVHLVGFIIRNYYLGFKWLRTRLTFGVCEYLAMVPLSVKCTNLHTDINNSRETTTEPNLGVAGN